MGGGSGSGIVDQTTDIICNGRGRGRRLTLFVAADVDFDVLIQASGDDGASYVTVDQLADNVPANGDAVYTNALKLQNYPLPSIFQVVIFNDGGADLAYIRDVQVSEDLALG